MKLSSRQLRNLINEVLAEDSAGPDLETVRAAEAKVVEAFKMLPKDFGPLALVKSAALALHNARKQMESQAS